MHIVLVWVVVPLAVGGFGVKGPTCHHLRSAPMTPSAGVASATGIGSAEEEAPAVAGRGLSPVSAMFCVPRAAADRNVWGKGKPRASRTPAR
eukprot:scaffold66474_cov48-Phaeocystis_antarctica.AAC.2